MSATHIPASASPSNWNRSYEWKAITLLTLGLGLVGLDRFIIAPLFPVMQKDLGLSYQDFGLVSAALAIAWGVAAVWTGSLSDRIGRKHVLLPALVAFSLLSACTGIASGMMSLILIRAVMGVAEGAYLPASIVSVVDAAKPTRTGLMVGIQMTAQPFLGLGLAPIIAVALLKVVPSWHWVFGIVAIPGLILALFMWKVLRRDIPQHRVTGEKAPSHFKDVVRYRAVWANTIAQFCMLSCIIPMSAFLPSYLTDHLKLSLDQMGMVLAGQGVGSLVGMIAVPALSDKFGRKPTILVALILGLIAWGALLGLGANPPALFAAVAIGSLMVSGCIAITVGPLTTEAVPAAVAASASGLVVGVGEIVGGALAPALVGGLAQGVGIDIIPKFAFAAVAVALIVVALGVRGKKAL